MVTMANNKTIETLNLKLADARHKLEQKERELGETEDEVYEIKKNITHVLDKLATEVLPTGLYYKGYKFKERDNQIILTDRDDKEVCSFNHAPTLWDLMDIERQYI